MGLQVTFNSSDVKHDLQQVMKGFRQLPIGMQRSGIRRAMKKATKPWIGEFQIIAPERTGALKRSVATITKFDRVSGGWWSKVGFTRSKKLTKSKNIFGETELLSKNGSHAVIVFEGTGSRQTKKGYNRGVMRMQDRMAAWAALSQRVRSTGGDVFVGALRTELNREIEKMRQKMSLKTR